MMLADRLHRPCTCGTLRLFRGSPKIRQGMSLHTLRKHGLPQACERGVNRVLGLIPGRMRMIDIEPRHLGNHVLGVLLPFFGGLPACHRVGSCLSRGCAGRPPSYNICTYSLAPNYKKMNCTPDGEVSGKWEIGDGPFTQCPSRPRERVHTPVVREWGGRWRRRWLR